MDRVAFNIFGIDVMWYGILIGIGMILAVVIDTKEAKRQGLGDDTILDLSIFIIPFGVIGARLYYVIFEWDYYRGDILKVIDIRGGGLAIHGGLLAGILISYIYSRRKSIPFFKLADVVVLGVPLAQSIGRWGNFINGEAHGGPTSLPWGIMVDGVRVHPTFLYESVWNLVIFFILVYMRKKKKFDGEILTVYIAGYSLGRFFIEGMRTDSLMFGPIRMAQLISIVGIVSGILLNIYLRKKKGRI